MSWDIVLFNTKQLIGSIEEVDEDQLEATDFDSILAKGFSRVIENDDHRAIKGDGYSIDYFLDDEPVSNKMISLYGENGLFELIELAKRSGWQIFDTGLGEMIDLNDPGNNGFTNHRAFVERIENNEN